MKQVFIVFTVLATTGTASFQDAFDRCNYHGRLTMVNVSEALPGKMASYSVSGSLMDCVNLSNYLGVHGIRCVVSEAKDDSGQTVVAATLDTDLLTDKMH